MRKCKYCNQKYCKCGANDYSSHHADKTNITYSSQSRPAKSIGKKRKLPKKVNQRADNGNWLTDIFYFLYTANFFATIAVLLAAEILGETPLLIGLIVIGTCIFLATSIMGLIFHELAK